MLVDDMARMSVTYFSQALQKMTSAVMFVPEGVEGPYAVLVQLHGLSDNETAWSRRTSLERYTDGLPLITVMPDGGRSFYCDAEQGFAYGKAIGEELPELVERWFPTRPGWAIGGLSMGGYGAVRLALTYPERFVSCVSHSGALAFAAFDMNDDEFGTEFERVVGPHPGGGRNDLSALARGVKSRPKIRFDCGTEDFLLQSNRWFDEQLTEIGYEHEYEEFPGDHEWGYWDLHVREALEFHKRNLGIEAAQRG